MEIYTNEKDADKIISVANGFGIEARVIGRVEESEKKELIIVNDQRKIVFD
jgi:phosphoribosylformylglycinamidine cyclo-ligase